MQRSVNPPQERIDAAIPRTDAVIDLKIKIDWKEQSTQGDCGCTAIARRGSESEQRRKLPEWLIEAGVWWCGHDVARARDHGPGIGLAVPRVYLRSDTFRPVIS